jgi:hypothetical protein
MGKRKRLMAERLKETKKQTAIAVFERCAHFPPEDAPCRRHHPWC